MSSSPQPVSRTDLEALLRELPGNEREGLFGPTSVSWRVNRESAVFLGAGRAALLQIAHPWVAAALAQHSNLLNDALGRFHSTFRVVYTMLFGTSGQALAAARQLHTRHSLVIGKLPGPRSEPYQANEVGALLWVYATLVESAVMAYEFALCPLAAGELAQYYDESKRMAALFGIPSDALPPDWAGFSAYTAAMLNSSMLEVDEAGRMLGASVLSGAGTSIRPPHWYRALTAGWLPEHLRAEFGLPFEAHEQRAVRRAAGWVPRVYRLLPGAVRFVGPWHEAEVWLRGREPGWSVRRSNRFWMGTERMLYPGR